VFYIFQRAQRIPYLYNAEDEEAAGEELEMDNGAF
jgi:hypothetical protein